MDPIVIVILVIAVISIIVSLVLILKNPFKYPYCAVYYDVTGRRNPDIWDIIDEGINQTHFSSFLEKWKEVQEWKKQCQNTINSSKLRQYRKDQFDSILDDRNWCTVILIRSQTRYKQENYVKTPYLVSVEVCRITVSFDVLEQRFKRLEMVNFECTLKQLNAKNQRSLMTRELRREIMIRDDFTCRMCGRYMPDGFGVHIDHIIPVSKGGKTVPSNLQVLCSKCNAEKSNRIY